MAQLLRKPQLNEHRGNLYWGYHTDIFIGKNGHQNFSTLHNWEIMWTFTSNDSGQPGTGSITIYNVAPQHMRSMTLGNQVSIWTGPRSIFGRLCLGKITKVTPGFDEKDHTITLDFSESAGYENQQAVKIFNGNKTVTTKTGKNIVKSLKNGKSKTIPQTIKKTVPKQVAMTFNRGIKASQILKWISNKAHIRISRMKLANDKIYNRGYRLSQRPLQAVQQISNDCGSHVYYRSSNLIIDDGKDNNPFNDHLTLGVGYGLLQQPTVNQQLQKNKQGQVTNLGTHNFTGLEDPRILAGSSIFFDPNTVQGMTNNLYSIKSITHQHNKDGYTMSGVVYG